MLQASQNLCPAPEVEKEYIKKALESLEVQSGQEQSREKSTSVIKPQVIWIVIAFIFPE